MALWVCQGSMAAEASCNYLYMLYFLNLFIPNAFNLDSTLNITAVHAVSLNVLVFINFILHAESNKNPCTVMQKSSKYISSYFVCNKHGER